MSDLNDVEIQIIYMIRTMKLFDKVEIKYSKAGQLDWQLTQCHRGSYEIDIKK